MHDFNAFFEQIICGKIPSIMTNIDNKLAENVPGSWYTNDECICCGLCGDKAPLSFQPTTDGDYHIVYRQPATEDEVAAALEAMDACPVDAIRNDGTTS